MELKYSVFASFLILGLFSLFIGNKHHKLYMIGAIDTLNKPSVKIINAALKKNESNYDFSKKLRLFKKLIITYEILFYFAVSLSLFLVFKAALQQ